MGEYIKNKKEMNFSSMDSLKPVQKVINEAAAALNDKNVQLQTVQFQKYWQEQLVLVQAVRLDLLHCTLVDQLSD